MQYIAKVTELTSHRSIQYQPKLTEILPGEKCPRGFIWSNSRDIFQVVKIIRTRLPN